MGQNESDVDVWMFQVFRMYLILLAKSAVLGLQDFLEKVLLPGSSALIYLRLI